MRLSQSNLKLLATCPRKFQHLYLDQFAVPMSLDQVERMAAGSQFHLLMQQHSLGLPITALLEADPQLKMWFETFERERSQILRLDENEQVLWQQSEHLRTIAKRDHVLTVVYDWVMLGATQGQIIDWKTYPKPLKSDRLAQDWQTRLYLYVLAETTNIVPEQLVMTYWFFQAQATGETSEVQNVPIRYSTDQHQQTDQDLKQLLDQLNQWLVDYEMHRADLPQVAPEQNYCADCAFAWRCGRNAAAMDATTPFSLETIAEVPI